MCYDRDKKLKHTTHVKMGSKFPIPPQPPTFHAFRALKNGKTALKKIETHVKMASKFPTPSHPLYFSCF